MKTRLFETSLQSKKDLSPSVKSLTFKWPHEEFHFSPGQWLDLYLDDAEGAPCVGYSYASSPLHKESFELLVKSNPKNQLTTTLHQELPLGGKVYVSPGQGKFIFNPNSTSPKLLIAGGMGLAPLLSMFRTYALSPEAKGELLLVHSVKTPEELIHHQEIEGHILKDKRLHYLPFLSGEGRLNAVYLRSFLDLLKDIEPDCYVCGPETMNQDMKNILLAFNIKEEKIKTEKWW